VFDGCVQTLGRDGEWHPAIESTLAVMGWLTIDGLAFCSKRCADRHAYAVRGVRPVVAVTKIHDASYTPTPRPVAAIQAARAKANAPEKTR